MIDKIRRIQIILGFVSFVYCLFNSDTFEVPIWLLPFVYTLGILLCFHNIVKLTPGILTINILIPISASKTGRQYNGLLRKGAKKAFF